MPQLRGLLSGLATVGGKAFEGYGIDRQIKVRDALAQAKQKQDEERDRVLNSVAGRSYDPERRAVVNEATATATPVAGLPPDAPPTRRIVAHQIAQDGTPYNVYSDGVWEKATVGSTASGAPSTAPATAASVEIPASNASAPAVPAAKTDTIPPRAAKPTVEAPAPKFGTPKAPVAGTPEWEAVKRREAEIARDVGAVKLTEPQEKSYLFYNLMEKSQPQIDEAMTSGKVRKLAISSYISAPSGAAQALVNSQLNTEEQSLVRAFRDFAAGVLRKESGAAVTPDELREVWGRYGPGFGDQPDLDTQKSQARIDYMNTMRDQALPAIEYYSKRKGSPAGGSSSGATRQQRLWDAAVAKHGREKVLRDFGPRP